LPFLARCIRCNFLMFAMERKAIRWKIEEHVEKSHNWEIDDELDILLFVIKYKEYEKLKKMAKNPKFWEAWRKSRKITL